MRSGADSTLQMSSRLGHQMPIKTDLHNPEAGEREPISHHSLSPLPHRSGGGIYGGTLPALQEPRYNTTSSYDHSPSPASATSLYSPYFQQPPTSYPTSSSYSPTVSGLVSPYSMASEQSRPRIPSMHSPISHHGPNPTSSVRSAYATSTPHTSRHHQPTQRPPKGSHSPVSPLPPTRAMRSPTVASMPTHMEPSSSPNNQAGPPMGNTDILCNLYSADGVLVEPEIHGRVEKGFFLADRDWTCYRRNYFTVVCSYSLKPTTHSYPYYLKRTPTSQPENVLSFAMCISAVIDAPGGKTVELVQHTPKRDKGPQHKPSKVKLAPQPAAGMGYSPNHQQSPSSADYGSFPQQTQLQNVASFERIQFKSATANNGKRRAAQQYYHLIVELYADVGSSSSSGPTNPQTDAGWVKIAYKLSAPMVVRGRSPGHYAEGGKVQSPGGNSGSGNGSNNTHSPSSNGNGGMMGGSDMGASPDMGHGVGRLGMGSMNGFHNMSSHPSNHTSPSSSSIRDPSISTPPPLPHMDGLPIDPVITGDENGPIEQDYTGYQYYPGPIYPDGHHHHHHQHMYEHMYERKSEAPLMTHSIEYDQDISSAYMPQNVVNDGRRMANYRRCGDVSDGSRGYFPDLPTV